MRFLFLFILLIVVVTLAPVPGDVQAAWPPDGLLVSSEYDAQEFVKIVSDGAGGMIVAWADRRDPARKIYGQRLDGSGNPYWADGGIQISGAGDQRMLATVSDDAGGAIILWLESTTTVWAQRVDGSGAVLWGANGIEAIWDGVDGLVAAADGAGGVIIAYNTNSSGFLYAQKINSSGTLMWDAGPGHVTVSDATTEENSPSISRTVPGARLSLFSVSGGLPIKKPVFRGSFPRATYGWMTEFYCQEDSPPAIIRS